MYLKKIIASGFKSFADKITIDLPNGIAGIVGPNGSGKSNVVDAIRWVLGEQSVKSLRGEGNMTDVIFSGSDSRKPLNVASVTLIFDNQDKYLNVDYNEVAIRRRVYRDGTNEYSINEEKCRLKDVIDLFLDTGVAKESFNIISQGKVDEIISSKPSERRTIFEEAASVLKYKKRKEEAIRKLEKTHDNMNRVNDIIGELENQVNPLKEQRNKAIIFKEKSKELENIEIALIVTEISNIHFNYENSKQKIEKLNEEIVGITTLNSSNEAKIEEYKTSIHKLDDEIRTLQQNLLEKVSVVEQLNSQKTVILERKKYSVQDSKLHDELVNLKEKELKLGTDIHQLEIELETKKEDLKDILEEYKKYEEYIEKAKNNKNKLELSLREKIGQKTNLEHQISYLQNSIENNNLLPSSVKNVIGNPILIGIHNTIGNVLEIEEKYSIAITTTLGASSNNVIVENEKNAIEAISYLKQNNLGRVTFFPMNVIKSRYIKEDILKELQNMDGFIGMASDLVKYDKKYQRIIENQLGNVIVAQDIKFANEISKKINHAYKIVTLEGDLLHVGGSLTGGTIHKMKNSITEKYELEKNIKHLEIVISEIKELENKINDNDYAYRSLEDKLYIINKEKVTKEEQIHNKELSKQEYDQLLEDTLKQIESMNNMINGTMDEEEANILSSYYQALEEKNEIDSNIKKYQDKRSSLSFDLEEFEFSLKRENSHFTSKNKELKELEIAVNRMDVQLDTLLNKLNETYSMTYEKGVKEYILDMEIETAKNKVNNLKKAIYDLGPVNIGSIEEYERVSTRYEFLNSQKEDLTKAEDTLLEIIEEMDKVMKNEFEKSFLNINEHFKETFKELFKGGHAELKLTDPNNLLETGIEIVACPPGKSLKSISLLSGGEKTFTAISLLFAILKSRPVPFCVLDEVEAALDEVNVDGFGEYITKLKEKTQFILITHKKRTMEYVDVLYGITMQESGVSKLVSVKLEDF